MAIGDCFSVFMGTAETDRQPASGVFEVVRSVTKAEATDAFVVYDGSNTVDFYAAATRTSTGEDAGLGSHMTSDLNTCFTIGNSVYCRKEGTTRLVSVSGVQVDT